MIFRNVLIQLIFDLIEEITIRIRNRRIEREKTKALEKKIAADKARLKKQTAQRIKEAKANFGKVDPNKYKAN